MRHAILNKKRKSRAPLVPGTISSVMVLLSGSPSSDAGHIIKPLQQNTQSVFTAPEWTRLSQIVNCSVSLVLYWNSRRGVIDVW